jgi:hypothetical protein
MGALAQAAQMPLELSPAQGSAHQHVTLECSALTGLHDFDHACAQSSEMVRLSGLRPVATRRHPL